MCNSPAPKITQHLLLQCTIIFVPCSLRIYVDGSLQCSLVSVAIALPTAPALESSTLTIVESTITYAQWTRSHQIMAYIMHSIAIPIQLSINWLTSSHEQWLVLSRMFVQQMLPMSISFIRPFRMLAKVIVLSRTSNLFTIWI